jgi:hypothetical protein
MRYSFSMSVLVAALTLPTGLCIFSACAQEPPRIPAGTLTPVPEGEGWINLFDAEHALHWKNVTDEAEGIFTLADGAFHIPGQKPTRYIAFMGETFGNFEMHIEFKVSPGTNSGVFVRSNPQDPVQGGMEVQVMEDFSQPPSVHSGGALYDVASPMFNMAMPAGEWNSYDIRFKGNRLEVIYNGWKVLDVNVALMTMPIGKFDTPLASLPPTGHIILQDHGGEVVYRNLFVRPIE